MAPAAAGVEGARGKVSGTWLGPHGTHDPNRSETAMLDAVLVLFGLSGFVVYLAEKTATQLRDLFPG
jgi:hypothetical protein